MSLLLSLFFHLDLNCLKLSGAVLIAEKIFVICLDFFTTKNELMENTEQLNFVVVVLSVPAFLQNSHTSI